MLKKILFTGFINCIAVICFSQIIAPIPGWVVSPKQSVAIAISLSTGSYDKLLVYQVRKSVATNDDTKDWFVASIKADILKEKFTEPFKGAVSEVNNVYLYVTKINDSVSKKWYLYYMCYSFGNGRVRLARIISTAPRDFFQTNGRTATAHFFKLASQDADATTAIVETNNQPQAEVPATVVNKPPVQAATQGATVKPSDIYSIIMHQEWQMGIGGIYPVYNPYLLFKDGSIYSEPLVGLADMQVAASRLSEPKKWGRWKVSGTTFIIFWPLEKPKDQNDQWKKDSYENASPAKKGETIQGSFRSLTGGGNTALGGDVMVVLENTISFNQQGKFIMASATGISGDDIWDQHNSKSNEAGSYILDGHTIELKFNNGKTERRFFYFYPDSRKTFGIGKRAYFPEDKL